MGRFVHKATGARVSVADGKTLGPEWEPEKKKPVVKPKPSKDE